MLKIIEKNQISLNMLRITLQGEQLNNISWKPGCYVKLKVNDTSGQKTRTYTARSYDPDNQTISIDFAIHQPAGPATRWALDSQIGDEVELRGPGHLRADPTKGDWHLFSADMSAMPAAISIIESLPHDAKGYAFLEILDEQDKQEFSAPEGIDIQWLIHSNPKENSAQQLDAIKGIKHLEGTPNVFVAGEMNTIKKIKKYFNEEKRFSDSPKYISSYWKTGSNEEGHKLAKMMPW